MEFRRESIFVSGARSFFSCFTGVFGVLIAVVLIIFLIFLSTGPSLSSRGTELTLLPDAQGERNLLPESAPVILQISIDGVIGSGELTGKAIQQILRDSREDFLKNDRVKAILLYMKTPGGTVDDSDSIFRSLLAYKQKYNTPIYAYVDGICASGGIYISAATDRVYSSPTSIIGSVGVVMGPFFNFSGAMDKVGIQALTLSSGKDKDSLNPFRPWQAGEDASLKKISQAIYDRFVTIITQARPRLNKEKLINEYGAEIFIAEEAQELGYIDVAGVDYPTALTDLALAANISEEKYQVVELSLPHNIFVDLAKGESPLFSGKMSHTLQLNPSQLDPKFSGKFLYLYQN